MEGGGRGGKRKRKITVPPSPAQWVIMGGGVSQNEFIP